jgi:hypothetical protein
MAFWRMEFDSSQRLLLSSAFAYQQNCPQKGAGARVKQCMRGPVFMKQKLKTLACTCHVHVNGYTVLKN